MTTLLVVAALLIQNPAPRPPSPTIVAGQVKFADGSPAPLLTIMAIPVSESARQANQRGGGTSDAGAFRIFNVQPGRYYIRANYSANSYIYYPGVTSEAAATAIDVVAGTNPSPLEFVLPSSASGVNVLGRARVPDGQPLAQENLRVEVRARPFGSLPAVSISSDGGFALTHVRPGTYFLSVPAAGFEPVTVDVASDDITGVELNVPKLIRVSGNLTINGNAPRPRFAIKFSSAVYQTSVSVQEGTFSVQLPPSAYRLSIAGLPAGYYLNSLTDGSNDLFVKPLTVAADASASVAVTLGLSNGVRIKGMIDGARADAETSFPRKLMLDGAAVDELAQTRVNADGTFEFDKLTPGTYVARMTISPGLSSAPIPLVIPNRNVGDLRVPVPEPREISGRVTVDGFGPPPKFTLMLSGQDSQSLQIRVDALPDGSFRLKLPQGTYRLASNSVPKPYELQSISILETSIDRNGGFSFSEVPQGAYALSIAGGSPAYQLTPTAIEVAGSDQSGLEISAVRTARLDRSQLVDSATGARVTEVGGSRGAVNNSSAVARSRTLNTAEVTYLSMSGGEFGTIPQLIAAGLLDKSFSGVVDGFIYSVIVVGKEYVIAGIPAVPEPGIYAFYSTPDGVIRYSTSDFLSPTGQNGKPVQ